MTEIGQSKEMLDTPVLWVDLDVLEANIALLMGNFRAAGVNWRPHTKGNKIPAIAHKLINAGAIGVTCAKLGEAEVMAQAGVRDILIANQVVGSHKYARLAALQRHADVKMAVDNTATLDDLGAAAQAVGVEIPVVVELNVGMNRAGVTPGTAAVGLAGRGSRAGWAAAGRADGVGGAYALRGGSGRAGGGDPAFDWAVGCVGEGLPRGWAAGRDRQLRRQRHDECDRAPAGGDGDPGRGRDLWRCHLPELGHADGPGAVWAGGGDEPPRARPDRHRRGLQGRCPARRGSRRRWGWRTWSTSRPRRSMG